MRGRGKRVVAVIAACGLFEEALSCPLILALVFSVEHSYGHLFFLYFPTTEFGRKGIQIRMPHYV